MSLFIIQNNFKIVNAKGRWDAWIIALNNGIVNPILIRLN